MFDYLQQFNNLSKDLRDRVSSPSVMAIIADLESKYQVDLAMAVMKVMIKSLLVKNLPAYFVSELGLAPEKAETLSREMKEKIFVFVAEYLGLSSEIRALDLEKDIDVLIKEAGLVLPSAVLISRFKNIVSTYLRGVRNKIDTKNSLSKDVKIGGLSLSSVEVERVLKVCDSQKFNSLKVVPDVAPQSAITSLNRLDKIIASSDNVGLNKEGKVEEYSLKNAIATGQVKIPASITPKPVIKLGIILDTKHEISAPTSQLDLPAGHMPVPAPPIPPKPILAKPIIPVATPVIPAVSVSPASSVVRVAPVPPVIPVVQASKPVAINKVVPAPQSISKPASLFNRLTSKLSPLRPATSKAQVSSDPVSDAPSIKPVVPTLSPIRPVSPIPQAPATPKQVITPQTVQAAPSLANRPAPVASSRPQMHDIKPVPKVMGPIEELQFLDVVNFRRLGKTPVESITKIFTKIKLLEKDGYDKMIAGIQAWRQSPVNRLYLRLGQEAVARGVTFKEAVDLRQKSNQEYLSMEEIEAIVSLNSRLVF